MTMNRRPANPIAQRKENARRYSRNAVLCVGGGLGGGIVVGLLTSQLSWFILGLVIAVAGGAYFWRRVQQIVNYRDPQ